MKNYLTKVPVALNVFVRPDKLKKVFSVVKEARPYILFLISDGPRNKEDEIKINLSRKVVSDIDWECKVYKIYSEKNQGMYNTYFSAEKEIFNKVDRCIFLEDDVLVSLSFFKFCEILLEKYKDDLRVHYITGMNYLGYYDKPDSDYFFAGEGSIWGYAKWKRTYLMENMEYTKSDYVTNCMCSVAKQLKPGYQKKIKGYKNNIHYENHIPGPEFYKNILRFSQNQVCIVPKKNMVSNIGVGEGSVHSSDDLKKMAKGNQKIFNMKLYEYSFPLKHPSFVVRDIFYEKKVNKILAWNNPFIKYYRKLASLIRNLIFGDLKATMKKVYNNLFPNKEN